MVEDPDLESYVPEVDGDEVEGRRANDFTGTILDGMWLVRSH